MSQIDPTPESDTILRELKELLKTVSADMSREVEEDIGLGEGVAIKGEGSEIQIHIYIPAFQLSLERSCPRKERLGVQLADNRKLVLRVEASNRVLHDWLRKRLREKLGNPLLDLAVDFDRLGDCLIEDDITDNDLPKATIDDHSDGEFPRKGCNYRKKFQAEYLAFAKALLETIHEFWETHGRQLATDHVRAQAAKTAGPIAAAAKNTIKN